MKTPSTASQQKEAIAALSQRLDATNDHIDRVTEILRIKTILASPVSTQDLEKAGGFVAHYRSKMLRAWLTSEPDMKLALLAALGVSPCHCRDVRDIDPCFHGGGFVPRGGEPVVENTNEAGIGSHEGEPEFFAAFTEAEKTMIRRESVRMEVSPKELLRDWILEFANKNQS